MPASSQLRCPQCQSSLSSLHLGSQYRWPQSAFIRLPAIGIECPSCGAKLRVSQTSLAVTWWILTAVVLLCARPLGFIIRVPYLVRLLGAVGALIGMLLLTLFAPKLRQVRLMSADEAAGTVFPLGSPEAEEDAEPGWVCRKCHEKNPENFELCWKCGHPKALAPASNNRWRGP
jgi:ribosomal protein L40E